MTDKHKRILLWIATCTAIVILTTLTLFSWSTNYNYCVRNNGSHYSGQYNDSDKPIIVPALEENLGNFRLLVHCGGIFTEQHSGAITASATILLLVVTALLGWIAYMQFTTTRAQLRAYLSVVIGQRGHTQDRAHNILFEGSPVIQNNGQTPAYKVRVWHRAEVIPDNVIRDYDFKIETTKEVSEATIGPKETRNLRIILPYLVSDQEAPNVHSGLGPCFWVWGIIHYEDAFGESHFTKFCQRLYWLPDGTIEGEYGRRHCDSD